MICPNCGCEQREVDRCVQCQMSLPGLKKAPASRAALSPPLNSSKGEKYPPPPEQTEKEERRPNRKESIRVVEPERRPRLEEGAHKILITTTQKIEGRKVKNYFGLINANIIIALDDRINATSDKTVYLLNAASRTHLKTGVLLALRDLRGEAALFGANAVIGTSFNFHRIDPSSLLISAVGTAVLIDDGLRSFC